MVLNTDGTPDLFDVHEGRDDHGKAQIERQEKLVERR
jgi:hypothetical protein